MSDDLLHIWCEHCNQSLCGLTEGGDFGPDGELGSSSEDLDCIVCADLWNPTNTAPCARVIA